MSPYLTWNSCGEGKTIAATHAFKNIKEYLYWLEFIIHKETMFLQFLHIPGRSSLDFKYVVFFYPYELEDLTYITENVRMSTFQLNWNLRIIAYVAPNIA
jgi:hypothetical protein